MIMHSRQVIIDDVFYVGQECHLPDVPFFDCQGLQFGSFQADFGIDDSGGAATSKAIGGLTDACIFINCKFYGIMFTAVNNCPLVS